MMCEVVPYIDFDNIAISRPKWFMGYSDNTNYTFLSATLADTAAIYGPCAGTFGMEKWHESLEDTYKLLLGEKLVFHSYDMWEKDKIKDSEHPFVGFNLTEKTEIKTFNYNGGKISGRLIGGCLDCLCNLVGTRFDKVKEYNDRYKEDGTIWFLEACDLNVFSIRRAMWNLREAGWFEGVKGFIIGRPLCYGEEMFGLTQYEAVTDIVKEFNVPVIMDIDIGHLPPQIPIVTGAIGTVDVVDGIFNIEYTLR